MNLLNILLVEDDPDDVELLLEALHDNGVEFSMEAIKEGDKVLSYLEVCNNFPRRYSSRPEPPENART